MQSPPRRRCADRRAGTPGGGQVTRRDLIAAGVSDNQIGIRVQRGQLIRRRRGVFAVGWPASTEAARVRTALLALGTGAVASHLTAAGAQGFWRDIPAVIDVTCTRRLRRRDGIRVHTAPVDESETRIWNGLPVTSPARTLFDLGTMLGATGHAKAANEAFVKNAVTLDELYATLARHAGRKGSAAFRRLLATLDPEGREVRSPLETRLNTFLRARGFPPWESNVPLVIGGETIKPDVLWRAERVVVEADGRDPHLAPLTFDSDRRRDRRLRVEGWQQVRVTSRDLDHRPVELDSDLRSLLRLI